MGIAVVVISLIRSFESGWLGWIEQHFGADLFVGRGQHVRLIAGDPMPLELASKIAGLPGVAGVEPFRTIRGRIDGRPVFIQGLSVEERIARGGLPMVEGSLTAASEQLLDGAGVLLSDNLAFKLSVHRGDLIMVPTMRGVRRFAVEGIYIDYLGSLDLGSILVAQKQLEDLWGDRSANLLRVWIDPQASPGAVRQSIKTMLQGTEPRGGPVAYYVLDAAGFLRGPS
jgi:ABC-type lipoprotein release transport system permease subunit